jgi:uncharacterized protein (DUF2164 family)
MKPIKFSRDETKAMVAQIQDYFRLELDQSIGPMPAEMLMTFFAEKMGAYYYNRGLHDAQELLRKKVESISEALYGLEQPTKGAR